MLRACLLPENEYSLVDEADIIYCMEIFYNIYEQIFGLINCTYSVHVVCSHLPAIRGKDPLTSTSAFSFESFYGEMRGCFVPGTQSTAKQIMKKVLIKHALGNHRCESPITITAHESPLESNNMIYVFEKKQYLMYQVVDINAATNVLTCKRQGKYDCQMTDCPSLNWKDVGVFRKGGLLDEKVSINMSSVSGKVLKVHNYLITCPNNILREK